MRVAPALTTFARPARKQTRGGGRDTPDEERPLGAVSPGQPARQTAGEPTHTDLHEHDVGSWAGSQLALRLLEEPRVARHDPPRDLLISRPGGVRDDGPALASRIPRELPHGILVGAADNDRRRALRFNRLDACRDGSRREVDNGADLVLAGNSGHRPTVIAGARARQHAFRSQRASLHQSVHGVRGPHDLERREPSAVRLVLDQQGPQAELVGQARESPERCFWEASHAVVVGADALVFGGVKETFVAAVRSGVERKRRPHHHHGILSWGRPGAYNRPTLTCRSSLN